MISYRFAIFLTFALQVVTGSLRGADVQQRENDAVDDSILQPGLSESIMLKTEDGSSAETNTNSILSPKENKQTDLLPSLIINRLLFSPPSTHVFTAVKPVGTVPSAPHAKHPVKPTRPPTLSPVKQPTRRPSMTTLKPPSASPVKLPTGRPVKQPVRRPAPPLSNFAGTPSPLNVPIQSTNGGPLPPFTCPPVSGTSGSAPGNATRCQHLSDCNGVFTSSDPFCCHWPTCVCVQSKGNTLLPSCSAS